MKKFLLLAALFMACQAMYSVHLQPSFSFGWDVQTIDGAGNIYHIPINLVFDVNVLKTCELQEQERDDILSFLKGINARFYMLFMAKARNNILFRQELSVLQMELEEKVFQWKESYGDAVFNWSVDNALPVKTIQVTSTKGKRHKYLLDIKKQVQGFQFPSFEIYARALSSAVELADIDEHPPTWSLEGTSLDQSFNKTAFVRVSRVSIPSDIMKSILIESVFNGLSLNIIRRVCKTFRRLITIADLLMDNKWNRILYAMKRIEPLVYSRMRRNNPVNGETVYPIIIVSGRMSFSKLSPNQRLYILKTIFSKATKYHDERLKYMFTFSKFGFSMPKQIYACLVCKWRNDIFFLGLMRRGLFESKTTAFAVDLICTYAETHLSSFKPVSELLFRRSKEACLDFVESVFTTYRLNHPHLPYPPSSGNIILQNTI